MMIELKDVLSWGAVFVGFLAQFFHLRNRVSLVEAKQDLQAKHQDEALQRIDKALVRIEAKIDEKADK